jgi:uncharacterized protein YtpQ (UPF0354 family)
MPRLADQVLPYLKATADESRPGLELDAKNGPVLVPFVGSLLVSYVIDEGRHFRLVTEGEREAQGLSHVDLRRAALANLERKIQATGVRFVPYGRILAVLFGGNLEATLLLREELVAHARSRLGPELLAAAPARDVLALSSPDGADELRAVISRVWPGARYPLTQDLYQHTERGWSTATLA